MSSINIDKVKLVEYLSNFKYYVQSMDNREDVNFRDSTSFLCREEGYKTFIAEEARKELQFYSWKESWIGSGAILDCVTRAMNKANNLVNVNQQIDFKNRLDKSHSMYKNEAEQVLFDIYKNKDVDEAYTFEKALEVFGAKYDTIAYLYFIKDDSRFLPISTSHFDKGFELLGIDYKTTRMCSWENYQGYIDIIEEIRCFMEEMLPMRSTPTLIDAHSFVWIIQGDAFENWKRNNESGAEIEEYIEKTLRGEVEGNGGRRKHVTSTYARSAEVARETKKRAKGICQLCNKKAPFNDKNGEPYLEAHHIEWLSRGGKDSTSNTVALCPNCHKRMHVLDSKDDIDKLLRNN